MNETVILFMVGQTLVIGGVILGAYINLIMKDASLSERLSRIETIIELLGEKAAKVLHSPHTPELDKLLEKYVDRHYELKLEEWADLLNKCEIIENDLTCPKDQRALAAIVSAVCYHKLNKGQFTVVKHY